MKYYYDLHLHSCLSPCADDDNTPNNLAGMAKLSGIDVLALTDHNSCKNCPAFFKAAERYGIIPIAGMELTTSEDIHVVCLFPDLESAMKFDERITKHRMQIKNRPHIFGEQLVMDENDRIVCREQMLLSYATDISVEQVPDLVAGFGGVCYPAHIDRDSNGIISILGTLPETPYFGVVELRDRDKLDPLTRSHGLAEKTVLFSSDAHTLEQIRDKENFLELPDGLEDFEVSRKLIDLLRERSGR